MPDSKVTVIPTFAKETEVNPFTDVSTDAYYYKAVKWAQEKEITGGIGNDLLVRTLLAPVRRSSPSCGVQRVLLSRRA